MTDDQNKNVTGGVGEITLASGMTALCAPDLKEMMSMGIAREGKRWRHKPLTSS